MKKYLKFQTLILTCISFSFYAYAEENAVSKLEDSVSQVETDPIQQNLTKTMSKDGWTLTLHTEDSLMGGSIPILSLSHENPTLTFTATCTIQESSSTFFTAKDTNNKNQYCLLGLPNNQKSGVFDIEVSVNASGNKTEFKLPVQIESSQNAKVVEFIDMNETIVRPDNKKVVQRLVKEELEVNELLLMNSPVRYWDTEFQEPMKRGRVTSHFGVVRIYNNNPIRRTHWGTDIAPRKGVDVFATAPGKVVLSKKLFFLGNTIIVDHGMGILSLYGHLNTRNVKVGDMVSVKKALGKVGRSGKATGTVLHFVTVVNRVKVDPLNFLALKLDEKTELKK